MRIPSSLLRPAAAVAVFGSLAPLSFHAQTLAAVTGTEAVITATPEAHHRVNVPGHHKKADETLLYGQVRNGVYTVDGMVAKVQLNYDVNGANFLYLFVPGVGTAIVSTAADPDAVVTQAKLQDDQLSFTVGDHHFNLTGITLASNRGTAPAHLYVKLDRAAWRLNRQPMVGFGTVAALPYAWPAALPPANSAQAEEPQIAPPVPSSLLPSTKAVTPNASAPGTVDPVALRPVAFR